MAATPASRIERVLAEFDAANARLVTRLEAPDALHPPADTTQSVSLAAPRHAAESVASSFSTLSETRAALTFSHPRVGTLALPQVGNWLVAHTIRHNAQMKRALGR